MPHISQQKKAIRRTTPMSNGARTWAEDHGYCNNDESPRLTFCVEAADLISSPLHASHEQNHPKDAEETTLHIKGKRVSTRLETESENTDNKVDLAEDLSFCLAFRVDPRRRMIEEDREEEANAIENADDDANISPARVILEQSAYLSSRR